MRHDPIEIVLQPQTTSVASATGNELNIPSGYIGAIIILNVTAGSGTSPTFNLRVQDVIKQAAAADLQLNPPTNATSLYDDFCSFTQATGVSQFVARIESGGTAAVNTLADGTLAAGSIRPGPIGTKWRLKWTVGGTNPSFTWNCTVKLIPWP